MSYTTKGLSFLFILALSIFLITASVAWAVNDLRVYNHGFDKYNVSAVTGIDQDALIQAARDIRSYFNSSEEPLEVRAKVFGQQREIFNDREIIHMSDVKDLIWAVYIVVAISGAYLVSVVTIGVLWKGPTFIPLVSRWTLWGGGATIGFVAIIGLVAITAFGQLFQTFHEVSFTNDFWKLDPSQDYLVMMFPIGFWFDATIFVALTSIGSAFVMTAVSGGLLIARKIRSSETSGPIYQEPEEPT